MGVSEKMERVTVAEAAIRLGVKEQAIRKRIQRGTLAHCKDDDGRVYVYLQRWSKTLTRMDYVRMKAYSEDLRQKIVTSLERGTSKSQAALLFDVSLSSVKRYARKARQGTSLAPKKGSGRPPKLDENSSRLLEEDIKERPAATVEQRRRFLEHLIGKSLSNSTVRRLLKRLGFSRKKGLWGRWSETNS